MPKKSNIKTLDDLESGQIAEIQYVNIKSKNKKRMLLRFGFYPGSNIKCLMKGKTYAYGNFIFSLEDSVRKKIRIKE